MSKQFCRTRQLGTRMPRDQVCGDGNPAGQFQGEVKEVQHLRARENLAPQVGLVPFPDFITY